MSKHTWLGLILLVALDLSCKKSTLTETGSTVQGSCVGAGGKGGAVSHPFATILKKPAKKVSDLRVNGEIKVLGKKEFERLIPNQLASFRLWLTDLSRDINTYGLMSWDQVKAVKNAQRDVALKAKKAWDDLSTGYATVTRAHPEAFGIQSTVYRGLRLDDVSLGLFLDASNKGSAIGLGRGGVSVWASASRRPTQAYEFAHAGKSQGKYAVLLEIRQRSGLSVESIEVIGNDVKEVLLPPMAKFRVKDVHPLKDRSGQEFLMILEEV